MKNGTLRLTARDAAPAPGAETKINAYVELASLKLDSEWAMSLVGRRTRTMPPVSLVFAGTLSNAGTDRARDRHRGDRGLPHHAPHAGGRRAARERSTSAGQERRAQTPAEPEPDTRRTHAASRSARRCTIPAIPDARSRRRLRQAPPRPSGSSARLTADCRMRRSSPAPARPACGSFSQTMPMPRRDAAGRPGCCAAPTAAELAATAAAERHRCTSGEQDPQRRSVR